MSIDELLFTIRERRLILIDADECWPSPLYTGAIRDAMRRYRRGLALLIATSSIETCPSRDLHRKYWRYAAEADMNAKCAERYTLHMLYKQNWYIHREKVIIQEVRTDGRAI